MAYKGLFPHGLDLFFSHQVFQHQVKSFMSYYTIPSIQHLLIQPQGSLSNVKTSGPTSRQLIQHQHQASSSIKVLSMKLFNVKTTRPTSSIGTSSIGTSSIGTSSIGTSSIGTSGRQDVGHQGIRLPRARSSCIKLRHHTLPDQPYPAWLSCIQLEDT
jgi:hypothetical protein